MLSELIKCRIVCDCCKKEVIFERDLWSRELPDGWVKWDKNWKFEIPAPGQSLISDGYGHIYWSSDTLTKCTEEHLCPSCKNVKDIIE